MHGNNKPLIKAQKDHESFIHHLYMSMGTYVSISKYGMHGLKKKILIIIYDFIIIVNY